MRKTVTRYPINKFNIFGNNGSPHKLSTKELCDFSFPQYYAKIETYGRNPKFEYKVFGIFVSFSGI